MTNKTHYASLTRRMVLTIILVSFTPLTLITGLMGYYFETFYRNNVLNSLHERVATHQKRINAFLDETLAAVRFIAEASTYDDLSQDKYLQNRLRALQRAYPDVFVDLGVINAAGTQVSYAGDFKLLDANYAEDAWFRDAVRQPYYLSDVFLGLRGKPHFIICVKYTHGGSDWLLRGTVNFAAFSALVDNLAIGETGSALIASSEGRLQSQPRIELIQNLRGLVAVAPWSGSGRSGASAVPVTDIFSTGKDEVTGRVESRGKSNLFILMPLKSGEWTLIYQQDWHDAFSEVNHARIVALTIFFSGCVTVLVVTFFVARRVVGRIERADLEKQQMNEQVTEARKLASIGELAAGVAHEINNPVAIMVEHAGWMEDLLAEEDLRACKSHEEFRHSLQQICLQGARCKDITRKLLSFARKTDPAQERIQLNDILREILSVYAARSKFNGIEVVTDLDPALPSVQASPTDMNEVFMNLFDNAIDAMVGTCGKLKIRTRVEGNHVIVDVADTGKGIPKEAIGRIFDPFFTTKPVGKGTGLGLSISYGIIQKVGGKLTVDSAKDVGTTFHVQIEQSAGA
ncbi:MAG: ATP-binding protein [Acidobacteriota bacterium]